MKPFPSILLATASVLHAQVDSCPPAINALFEKSYEEVLACQKRDSSWTITSSGEDILMNNAGVAAVAPFFTCEPGSAPCAPGKMSLFNPTTGRTLRMDNFAPICQPRACLPRSYKTSLEKLLGAYKDTPIPWYAPDDAITKSCEDGNHCRIRFELCEQSIEEEYHSDAWGTWALVVGRSIGGTGIDGSGDGADSSTDDPDGTNGNENNAGSSTDGSAGTDGSGNVADSSTDNLNGDIDDGSTETASDDETGLSTIALFAIIVGALFVVGIVASFVLNNAKKENEFEEPYAMDDPITSVPAYSSESNLETANPSGMDIGYGNGRGSEVYGSDNPYPTDLNREQNNV